MKLSGTITKVSGPLVVANGLADANVSDVVRVGEQRLIGEILNMTGDSASIQVYEETSGLGPGAKVETTGMPLSVELGPGMLENIYDGIQRPLPEIRDLTGSNITRGIEVPALNRERVWHFDPVVQPGTAHFSAGSLVALLAALLSAIVAIQIKQLSKVDGPDTIVLWTYLCWVPMSLLPALVVWHWPQGIAWLWLALCGVFGTGGQWLWTRALKLGEVSALTPISFMQLPVVTFAGWWLFGETVDRWTMIGAAIILAATAYIAHREAQLSKRQASHAACEAVEPGS